MPRIWWSMHALGRAGLPLSVSWRGRKYALCQRVKHDFWAATGFYDLMPDPADEAEAIVPHPAAPIEFPARIVVKVHRRERLLGWPMQWIGRWLAMRESRAYADLSDTGFVPPLLGRLGATGFAHVFVPAATLGATLHVPASFFDHLTRAVDVMNARGIAYVDLNKPQNVLIDAADRPQLIDFQISCYRDAWWPRALGRWWLGIFHAADHYHVLKHKSRLRPDLMTPLDLERLERRIWPIRLHRRLTRGYFALRRPLMRRLRLSGRLADSGSD